MEKYYNNFILINWIISIDSSLKRPPTPGICRLQHILLSALINVPTWTPQTRWIPLSSLLLLEEDPVFFHTQLQLGETFWDAFQKNGHANFKGPFWIYPEIFMYNSEHFFYSVRHILVLCYTSLLHLWRIRGTWGAQLVRCPTLGLSSFRSWPQVMR